MSDRNATVSLVAGLARVQIGRNTFTVAEREAEDKNYNCPLDLVVGALGS